MPVSLTIKDQAAGARSFDTFVLANIPDRTTLRDLIRTRVREEVAAYNLKPLTQFKGLVMPEGAQQTPDGFTLERPRRIDWEKQADAAIAAFERNGFFVLVGGKQMTDLDAELDLKADSDLRFVRLVPLIGG